MDLIEVDAASNRGIDEMRSLREKVNFAPNEARSKVYIIDEVHMLTNEAFNAVLKTLEEPPPHTIFILATTEPHKLPATVVSRCQRFDFKRIPLSKTAERLAYICEHEGVKASPETLNAIARGAWGSLRDAENMLEQMVVSYGNDLGYEQIKDFLGLGGEEQVLELIAAIIKGDIPGGLAILLKVVNEGLDLGQFHRRLMEYLRGLLLVKSGIEAGDVPADHYQELQHLADGTSIEVVIKGVREFGKIDLRSASYSALPFELALVELAEVPSVLALPLSPQIPNSSVPDKKDVTAKHQRSRPVDPELAPARSELEPNAPQVVQDQLAEQELTTVEDLEEAVVSLGEGSAELAPDVEPLGTSGLAPTPVADGEDRASSDLVSSTEAGVSEPEELDNLRREWKAVIAILRGEGHKFKMDALLRSGEPVLVEEQMVTLGFQYQIFVDRMNEEMENPATRKELEEAVGGVVGGRRRVCCVVTPKQKGSGGHLVRAAVERGAKVVEDGG